uniref:Uncharacterized protein n=1 Tax=Salmo trutta TaxID=8032 RepID=A0A674C8E7_SALTR
MVYIIHYFTTSYYANHTPDVTMLVVKCVLHVGNSLVFLLGLIYFLRNLSITF